MRAVKLTADISAKSLRTNDWRIPAFTLCNEAGEIILFFNTRKDGRKVMKCVKYNFAGKKSLPKYFCNKFDVLNFAQEQMTTYRFKVKRNA